MDLEKEFIKEESTNPFVICDNFIKNPENVYIFGSGWKEKFLKSLKIMDQVICKLEKDEPLGAFSYQIIEECVNFCNSMTIEKQAFPDFLKFMSSYIYIAHNVNQNTYKYESVTRKISYLQRYCDSSLTFNECISLLRLTTRRLSRWKEWSPPSFRLSGHYFDTFKEE